MTKKQYAKAKMELLQDAGYLGCKVSHCSCECSECHSEYDMLPDRENVNFDTAESELTEFESSKGRSINHILMCTTVSPESDTTIIGM